MVRAGPGRAGLDAGIPLRPDRGKDLALRAVVAGGRGSLAPNGLRMLKRLGVGEGIGRVAARHLPAQLLLSGGLPARDQPHH